MEQFYRMCDEFGWNKGDPEKKEARDLLSDAITRQFNDIYGTDEDDIGSWQNLCRVLRISIIPEDLEGCKRVRQIHLIRNRADDFVKVAQKQACQPC
jgi:hypothetical protein